MRRREEALVVRAARSGRRRLDDAARKFGKWGAARLIHAPVGELQLKIDSGTDAPTAVALLSAARVVDGLGAIGCGVPGAGARRTMQQIASSIRVMDAGLVRPRPARSLEIEHLRRIRVREFKGIGSFRIHSILLAALADKTRVLSTPLIRGSASVRRLDGIEPRTGIRDSTHRILKMPQIRTAVDPALLSLKECESCLREAEVVRGIPAAEAELIAVFRRIPVEGVIRIRFHESSGVLFFALATDRGIRRARVHDVMAIRNTSTGQVHLVTHRTRFQTAVLS